MANAESRPALLVNPLTAKPSMKATSNAAASSEAAPASGMWSAISRSAPPVPTQFRTAAISPFAKADGVGVGYVFHSASLHWALEITSRLQLPSAVLVKGEREGTTRKPSRRASSPKAKNRLSSVWKLWCASSRQITGPWPAA
ncbi:MAG: hypothetical protein IPJ56_00600 [Gemmatimonadetes bacterium]|nr:hypothetical protein [Gemmatimonadota bacterium]